MAEPGLDDVFCDDITVPATDGYPLAAAPAAPGADRLQQAEIAGRLQGLDVVCGSRERAPDDSSAKQSIAQQVERWIASLRSQ